MTHRRRTILGDALAIVMAGGQGERLYPLTRDRGKPAVPFGGTYRVIDFTLSNCLNSGLRKIYVLTQYKSGSLERHVRIGWGPLFSDELDEYIQCVPPQLRIGQRWYQGTADAVYQNVYLLEQERPRYVLILSGDHVYKMDYAKLIEFHEEKGAIATVAAVEVPVGDASSFGVIAVDEENRITRFEEKPATPTPVPGRPDTALVNMGVYVFDTDTLVRALAADARQESRHDFGHDILPGLVPGGGLFVYPFVDENKKSARYWRDIGTLDSYYEASMDLVAVEPVFNLYDKEWPIRTMARYLPPAKTVFAQEEPGGRLGIVLDSLVSGGVIVSGGRVERSVLGPEVRVNSYAKVADCVLMDGVDVGRHARLTKAIVDKGVRVPPHFVVGENAEDDKKRFQVTPSGVVVIPREALLD
ncbi:MAG TPA: glucose-1-phosphate adenylyltransferase [Candidatus Polarisedimenticolaceae bacterium]|nr:glucose-1-phosphate adenylyltransferase [Candidatus Polarisedimenticolaceae bacterium]